MYQFSGSQWIGFGGATHLGAIPLLLSLSGSPIAKATMAFSKICSADVNFYPLL